VAAGVGSAVKLDANIGNSIGWGEADRFQTDPVLVVTHSGTLYLLDLKTGAELQRLTIGGTVIGTPAVWKEELSR
jgi:hypothetical protein